MVVKIHPTAIIEDGADIGEGTEVGPYSIIRSKVKIGKNCWVGPHAVIEGNTSLGDENKIFQFASVGAVPQDLKYKGENSQLNIGNKNIIREYVTLQPGTEGGGMVTKIGSGNLFMANTHVGHDCIIGDSNIFANSAALSGHVTIGNRVVLGGLSGVHQFCSLGDFSMMGGGAIATQDIPPFVLVHGNRAEAIGINKVALLRGGFSKEDVSSIEKIFRILYLSNGLLKEKLEKIESEYGNMKFIPEFIQFIRSSKRGIVTLRKGGDLDGSE